jgi:hypothetical protein
MYTIGALYSVENGANDDFRVEAADPFATIPQLRYLKALYTQNPDLMIPATEGVDTKGYFGPNFTVIPEPSSLTLASTAALGLIGYLSRRRGNKSLSRSAPRARLAGWQ